LKAITSKKNSHKDYIRSLKTESLFVNAGKNVNIETYLMVRRAVRRIGVGRNKKWIKSTNVKI